MLLQSQDSLAIEMVDAIQNGDIPSVKRLLNENKGLATARIGDGKGSRSLLDIATDWPGHFPNVAETIRILVSSGAELNPLTEGGVGETALHWAASSDDVEAIDALLDCGADIEAPGAVLGGGPPLSDAVGFGQWKAARRLVERGAITDLPHSAALGLMDQMEKRLNSVPPPSSEEINHAFWYACHGGQRETAEHLLDHGADSNWLPPWEDLTPLDTARREGTTEFVDWLRSIGAKSATDMKESRGFPQEL